MKSNPSRPGLILQLQESGPPARLGSWLEEAGRPHEVREVWQGGRLQALGLDERPFLAVLGSASSVTDSEPRWIGRVRTIVEQAVEQDVPVLGICFGAQLLSSVLGGSIRPVRPPEVEWRRVSTAGRLVPPGPWLVWHYESFTVPPGAKRLAWTDRGPLAFQHGPHLGIQFHAEATPAQAA